MTLLADLLAQRTKTQLSKLSIRSGVSPERLAEMAQGSDATLSELRRLAPALGVLFEELLPTNQSESPAELLFRRSIGPGAKLPVSASRLARKMTSSLSLTSSTSTHVGPHWKTAFLPPEDSVGSAETNAAIFRTLFYGNDQLSPITTLPSVASERMGVLIYVLNSSDIDGASAFVDNSAFAFVSTRFSGRMLFTLAHELGHLVAHHGNESFALIDEDIESTPDGQDRDKEAYANAFASALLMPRQSVGITLKTVRRLAKSDSDQLGDTEINLLSRIYGVSFWAAARRCEDLELIPRGGAYALHTKLVELHGSAEQRADELGLPPRPEIRFPKVPWPLLQAAVANVRAGEMSVGKAASALGISIADLYSANAPTKH